MRLSSPAFGVAGNALFEIHDPAVDGLRAIPRARSSGGPLVRWPETSAALGTLRRGWHHLDPLNEGGSLIAELDNGAEQGLGQGELGETGERVGHERTIVETMLKEIFQYTTIHAY